MRERIEKVRRDITAVMSPATLPDMHPAQFAGHEQIALYTLGSGLTEFLVVTGGDYLHHDQHFAGENAQKTFFDAPPEIYDGYPGGSLGGKTDPLYPLTPPGIDERPVLDRPFFPERSKK